MTRKGPPPPSDPEQGVFEGRAVARRFVSPDGMTILVGRTAADNDVLTLRLGRPQDFWLHVSGESGSHVVVRNDAGLERLPRDTKRFAAGLAVGYSKARKGGRTAVHLCRVADVSKRRGQPPGQVELRAWETVHATPLRPTDEGDAP